jgi:hypothetical protein
MPFREDLPRLPVRAAVYVAPDGTVHFGALFEDLVPVARALGAELRIDAPGAAERGATDAVQDGHAPHAGP